MNPSQVQFSPVLPAEHLDDLYFDFQADIGMTKHIGGKRATDELLKLCHIDEHSTILDVGCGVGFTALYIAGQYKARVVGVDLRPHMIERARQHAKEAGLESYVSFQVADAQDLPLSDNVYDAVICESVLAFIPDQNRALREWMRVAKPGGYIGVTEAIWIEPPPEDAKAQMDQYTGAGSGVQAPEKWEALLQQSGLKNLICHRYPPDVMKDARHEIQRIGLGRLFKAWGKALKLMITNADYRRFMRQATRLPRSLMKYMGHGVFVGQVPIE